MTIFESSELVTKELGKSELGAGVDDASLDEYVVGGIAVPGYQMRRECFTMCSCY